MHRHPIHPFFSDFSRAFSGLLNEACCQLIFGLHGPRGGGAAKLSAWQWIMARVYHEFARSGTFSANVKTITRVTISDGALSQRALSIGWKLIDEILPAVLRPLANPARHPGAFHGGYRLAAFDGTRFNLRNTQAINVEAANNRCSKGSGVSAFAQLLTLARKILARQSLPDRCQILADRLFGIPSLMWELMPMLEKSASAVLFRVKSNLKVTRVRQLGDGSWLVSIPVIKPGTRLKIGTLLSREIHAGIHYEGGAKPLAMRLWTSLLDEKAPPTALVELYASRGEEELFFRELKSHLR